MKDPVKLLLGIVLLGFIGWLTLAVILPFAVAVIGFFAWPLVLVLVGAGVVLAWKRLGRS